MEEYIVNDFIEWIAHEIILMLLYQVNVNFKLHVSKTKLVSTPKYISDDRYKVCVIIPFQGIYSF
jgi:hypothetical protein